MEARRLYEWLYPIDNSYAHELGKKQDKDNPLLAGTVDTDPKLVQIYSRPFELETSISRNGTQMRNEFITVKSEGRFYNVLNKFKDSFDPHDHDGSWSIDF